MLKISAVIALHNNPYTISKVLDQYKENNIGVVIIDDGSTDETPEIIKKYINDPVIDIHTLQFDGTFDLVKILDAKKRIISNLNADWIIHADSDEIFESPVEGESLRECIERISSQGADVIDCDEFVFVPENESVTYRPGTFVEKMNSYFYMNKPGRALHRFIRSSSGDIDWSKSGGHRVDLTNRVLANEKIRMRHYIGLSLDHLRMQYYSRVFSAKGIINRWHGTRIPSSTDFVRVPPAEKLYHLPKDGWRKDRPESSYLVFDKQEVSKRRRNRFKPILAVNHEIPLVFLLGGKCSGVDLLKYYMEDWHSLVCSNQTKWLKGFLDQISSPDLNIKDLVNCLISNTEYAKMGLDRKLLDGFLQTNNSIGASDMFRKIFSEFAKNSNCKVYCDITPQPVSLMYKLATSLPEAKFIHVIRDGRDEACCLQKNVLNRKAGIRDMAIKWVWNIREARQQAEFLPFYLEVRYESLIENPEYVLKKVADFIGIPRIIPETFYTHQAKSEKGIEKWFRNLRLKVRAGNWKHNQALITSRREDFPMQYRSILSKKKVACFERIAGSLLCDLGYK